MSVSREDVRKLARLTRLKLTEREEAEAVLSLNAVMELIDELQRADVDGIDDTAYVQPPEAVQMPGRTLRCREPQPQPPFAREQLLQNAPDDDGEYFLVPKVVE